MRRDIILIKNTLIILFGKVCTQLISYLLLPVYTTVLSTEEYGTVDLLITYVTLIAPVITLQFESAVFRFLIDARDNQSAESKIITNGVVCLFISVCGFCVVYGILSKYIMLEYAFPFILCVIANALISIFLQVARGLGDNIVYAVGSAISGIFTVFFNILFIVIYSFGVSGMMYATALSQIIGTLYIFAKLNIVKYIDFKKINLNQIREMSKYSLPLIPNSLSWWIISVSDRTLVSIFIGVDANGILAVATKFSTIVVNVFSIFNLSWTESVAVHINDEDGAEYISKITNQCFKMFASCGLVLIMGCSVFFKYLVGVNFLQAYNLIPLLVVGSILNVLQTLYGIIYIGLKDTKQVSKSSLMAAAINMLVDLMVIRYIGLYAAAVSTICAMLLLSIYRYIDVNRIIKIKISFSDIRYILLAYGLICIIYFWNNNMFNIIGLIASVFCCMIWNRSMIASIYTSVSNRVMKS